MKKRQKLYPSWFNINSVTPLMKRKFHHEEHEGHEEKTKTLSFIAFMSFMVKMSFIHLEEESKVLILRGLISIQLINEKRISP